jgi:hypothetical protein
LVEKITATENIVGKVKPSTLEGLDNRARNSFKGKTVWKNYHNILF